MKTDFSRRLFEKKTTAPIIFSLLIAIILGLQFVPGYFQCSYSTDTKVYNKSYYDLVGATDASSIITFIFWALLIAILVIIWDRTKKNKEYISSILVCTATAFLLLLVCSFLGSSGYYDTVPFFGYYYCTPLVLYQFSMSFNCLFNPLRFDADVSLRNGCAAMLQQTLDKGNVIAVVPIDFRGVPFSEAVSADALITEVITDAGKYLLHLSCSNRKNQLIRSNAVSQAVILYILLNHKRNSENALLSCFLLNDGQTIAPTVKDNISRTQTHNVADP